MPRIFDILLIMLLNPDTARVSVQKLNPVTHKEYFINRQWNPVDQLSVNSNYQAQESNISNDADDSSVGDINEITFSMINDDDNNNNNDDEAVAAAAAEDDDEDDDDDENYDDEEGEQEESDEEKRVNFFMKYIHSLMTNLLFFLSNRYVQ